MKPQNISPEQHNFDRMSSPEFFKAITLFGKVCEAIKEQGGKYKVRSSSALNNHGYVFHETMSLFWPDGYFYNCMGIGDTPADAHIACINDINQGMLSNLGIFEDTEETTDPTLTDDQLEAQSIVDTACRELLNNYLSDNDCEDIEIWGELRDVVVTELVKLTGKSEMEIYPYLHTA